MVSSLITRSTVARSAGDEPGQPDPLGRVAGGAPGPLGPVDRRDERRGVRAAGGNASVSRACASANASTKRRGARHRDVGQRGQPQHLHRVALVGGVLAAQRVEPLPGLAPSTRSGRGGAAGRAGSGAVPAAPPRRSATAPRGAGATNRAATTSSGEPAARIRAMRPAESDAAADQQNAAVSRRSRTRRPASRRPSRGAARGADGPRRRAAPSGAPRTRRRAAGRRVGRTPRVAHGGDRRHTPPGTDGGAPLLGTRRVALFARVRSSAPR